MASKPEFQTLIIFPKGRHLINAPKQLSNRPLSGIKVVEFAGLGPAPLCGMLLADLGATVLRIDRLGQVSAGQAMLNEKLDVLQRGRLPLALDLKSEQGKALALEIIGEADVLIEGFRPGVLERLGLGPDVCHAKHPQLVYGRVTGWGQEGPLAHSAGHDINYLAITGALHMIGNQESGPIPPINFVADYAGGAMFLAFGVMAALLQAKTTGQGQVVDAAMVDGVNSLLALTMTLRGMGMWKDERHSNLMDGAAPRYATYLCADGKHIAIGALEPQFYAKLLQGLGLAEDERMQEPDNAQRWPLQRQIFANVFKTQSRDHWAKRFEGTDACLSPVLSLTESPSYAHNASRGNVLTIDGLQQPGVAPRFSGMSDQQPARMPSADANARSSLHIWGWDNQRINTALETGLVR